MNVTDGTQKTDVVALSWMVSESKTEDRVLEVALPKAAN